MKKLHEKYGPIVRIGPNLLDLDIPELYRVIYGTDGKWIKSDFYKNSSSIIDKKQVFHMFSEVDPALHAQIKRPVVRHYSVPAVLTLEPLMDSVIKDFINILQNRYVKTKKTCQFGDWLGYCKHTPPSSNHSRHRLTSVRRCLGLYGHGHLQHQVRIHGQGLRLRRYPRHRRPIH